MSKLYIEKEWITEDGYLALVTLTPMGHRCGYVVVNKNHPAYGKEYYTFTDSEPINPTEQAINNIEVHGGLTYADKLKFKVEHVTEPKEDTWVFGFDAAHCDDAPDREATIEVYKDNKDIVDNLKIIEDIESKYPMSTKGIIRTLDYMVQECNKLSKQLGIIEKFIKE